MSKPNGGPAFPRIEQDAETLTIHAGMTLRDWFAGHAISKALNFEHAAQDAYAYADAMLAEREK